MKKYFTLLNIVLIFVILSFSCKRSIEDPIAYQISEKDLFPEGITYSSSTNSFYLSSIYKTKIIQIDSESGRFKDFISSDLMDISFLGMITDDLQNYLWACGNKTRDGKRYSTIAKFNLKTGELLKSYQHVDSVANTYNDIVLDNKGNVYFTNYPQNRIMFINTLTDSVSIFFESSLIEHPNGITISPDNKYLYIASGIQGIKILDVEKRKLVREVSNGIESAGIDGLKYYRNSLLAVQNGFEDYSKIKICQYFLDETESKITNMEIIDQNNPLFDIPTTFVIVSNHLYCLANSQLSNIRFPEYEIINQKELKDILILKYALL